MTWKAFLGGLVGMNDCVKQEGFFVFFFSCVKKRKKSRGDLTSTRLNSDGVWINSMVVAGFMKKCGFV